MHEREEGVVIHLHAAPDRVRDPVSKGVIHTHDLGTSEEVIELEELKISLGLKDGHTELGGNNQLVALKETLSDVSKDSIASRLHKEVNSLLEWLLLSQLLSLRHLALILPSRSHVHTLGEDVDVVSHGVVVDAVEGVEVVDEEVGERAASGDRAVDFSRLCNVDLSGLCELDLLLDLNGSLLRLLEVLDEFNVLEDVALGVCELEEEGVLKVCEGDRVLVELPDQRASL